MKLKHVTIHKYKSIESEQSFDVENDITILVGMNESGKTSILESLAKSNYFIKDKAFVFNKTHDYPRKEKKKSDKVGDDPIAVTCVYEIDENLIGLINKDVGVGVFTEKNVAVDHRYSNQQGWGSINCDKRKFIEGKTSALGISSKTLNDKLDSLNNSKGLDALIVEYKDETIVNGIKSLAKYFKNDWGWSNPIAEYITRTLLKTHLPKYLYYDEYYALPSRISIENLQNEELDDEEQKTAKALFELADINVDELIEADTFEDFKAELEATQATISDELFKYWGTNKNLEITFDIDKIQMEEERIVQDRFGNNQSVTDVKIVEHVLEIRVRNRRTGVSLPLKNRSKGFNWFFSFLVWFKKIQEDNTSQFILLLDEPGLNLHASAQSNLLNFLRDLSSDYQIIYTTHSPFMIESDNLQKVRTVFETEQGSIISDSIQEKDPNTLFPLQAALGYDIAQNLFISKHNLLVEGASDLLYLQVLSSILQVAGRTGLDDRITIVPTGGLDKVTTFISLLRGSDLNIVCLLDTYKDGQQKFQDLIDHKIIAQKKIRFFDEFLNDYTTADIEDLFTKDDYLKLYNEAFPKAPIKIADLNSSIKPTLIQISKFLNIDRFNHYRPANVLAAKGANVSFFDTATLDNFENVFKTINQLFEF